MVSAGERQQIWGCRNNAALETTETTRIDHHGYNPWYSGTVDDIPSVSSLNTCMDHILGLRFSDRRNGKCRMHVGSLIIICAGTTVFIACPNVKHNAKQKTYKPQDRMEKYRVSVKNVTNQNNIYSKDKVNKIHPNFVEQRCVLPCG